MTVTFEHGYALVVGVNDNNISRLALPTVEKDVQAFYDVLVHPQRCGYKKDNVRLIKGSDSTKANIMDGLYWLQQKIEANSEATAIVYYSGHGMVDKNTNKYYLIPYEIPSIGRIRHFAIEAEALNTEISAMNPKRLLVVLDCCHADGMDVKDLDADFEAEFEQVNSEAFPMSLPQKKDIPQLEKGVEDLSELAEGNGRAILNSSTGAEKSYVRPDGKMSVFTYHLIESLTGRGAHEDGETTVDVAKVMSYVTFHVKNTVKELGKAQTPVMRTTGVFPVAMLLGGEPFAKGITDLPDPLEPLSEAMAALQVTVGDGSTVAVGDGATAVGERGVNVGGNVGGNIVTGDKNEVSGVNFSGIGGGVNISGGVAGRDMINHGDSISVGDISGSSGVAIGRGASATVNTEQGLSARQVRDLFAPIVSTIYQENPAILAKVSDLEKEAAKGSQANDETMADLIQDIADAAPSAVEGIIGLFVNGALAKLAGGATKFVLKRLRR